MNTLARAISVHSQDYCMSIKARMTLLLGILLIAFLGVMQFLRQKEQVRGNELQRDAALAGTQTLWQWISLANQPLQRFARDFSEWPEMAAFLEHRDAAWADRNLKPNLANYEAHALWVLAANGEVLYSAQANPGPPLPPPATPTDLIGLARRGPAQHLFAESRDGLLQVWGEPIALDRQRENLNGWLVVARWWSPRFMATLNRRSEMRVQLLPAGSQSATDTQPLLLSIRDLQGTTLRQLQASLPLPDYTESLAADTLAVRVLLLFGALVITTVWLGVHQWVLRPLRQISQSLDRQDVAPLSTLQHEPTEWGRVAQLVGTFFAQRDALRKSEEQVRRSLELRARLARDLHDGVIQSVYAAGLGLESALAELEHDQGGARTRLTHCRQSLNSVIREVRGFINGLEPEQMQPRGFAAELAALAGTMQALGSARIVPNVDVSVAQRLDHRQEVHALQITRECISNALRHGAAKVINLTLAQDAEQAILTIHDDGHGFDPAQVTGRGSGLQNLASRARELGGTLRVESQIGRGTTVRVVFPIGEASR